MQQLELDEIVQCYHHLLAQKHKYWMSGLIRQADETMKILMQIEDAATQLEVLASCDAKAQSTTVYTGNLHDLVGELINFLPVCFDSVSLEHLIGALRHYAAYVNPTNQPWKSMRLKKSNSQALFRKCLQQLYNASVDMLQRAVHFHREFCKNKEMLKALNMKRMSLELLVEDISATLQQLSGIEQDESSQNAENNDIQAKISEYRSAKTAPVLLQASELTAKRAKISRKVLDLLVVYEKVCHAIHEANARVESVEANESIERCIKNILKASDTSFDAVSVVTVIASDREQFLSDIRTLEESIEKKKVTVHNCVLNLETLMTQTMDFEMLDARLEDWLNYSDNIKKLERSSEYKTSAKRVAASAKLYQAVGNAPPLRGVERTIQDIEEQLSQIFLQEFKTEIKLH